MDLVSDGIRWFIGPGLQALLMLCLLALRCQDKESAKEESMTGGRGRGWFLFRRKDDSEIYLENMEQTDLVAFNGQVSYDLGELLRASTFVLGKSGVGIVYKVVLEDGLTLAVRRLGEGGSQRFKEFQAEVKAIGRIRQCNIVTLRAYYWSVDDKLLIYDYIPNGSLVAALHGRLATSSPLLWVAHLKIAKSVAKGLAHIHECSPNKYIHGDLNPTNILLGLNMEPYIADFGLGHLASIAGSLSTREHVMIGTTHPERKLGSEAQSASVPSMGFTTQGILISPGSSYRCSNMIRLQMDLT